MISLSKQSKNDIILFLTLLTFTGFIIGMTICVFSFRFLDISSFFGDEIINIIKNDFVSANNYSRLEMLSEMLLSDIRWILILFITSFSRYFDFICCFIMGLRGIMYGLTSTSLVLLIKIGYLKINMQFIFCFAFSFLSAALLFLTVLFALSMMKSDTKKYGNSSIIKMITSKSFRKQCTRLVSFVGLSFLITGLKTALLFL